MDRIGAFTPQQAEIIWRTVQQMRQLQPQLQRNHREYPPSQESHHRVIIKNIDESQDVPPFGCCQVVGTEAAGNATAVTVRRPSGSDGEYLINSEQPIPLGEYGYGYRYYVVRFRGTNSGTGVYRPVPNTWHIERGPGPFVVYGADDTFPGGDVLVGRFAGGDRSRMYGFQTLGPVNSASVSATIYELDGEVFGSSLGPHTLYDPARWYDGADSGSRGICCLQGGRFYAMQSGCLGGL